MSQSNGLTSDEVSVLVHPSTDASKIAHHGNSADGAFQRDRNLEPGGSQLQRLRPFFVRGLPNYALCTHSPRPDAFPELHGPVKGRVLMVRALRLALWQDETEGRASSSR